MTLREFSRFLFMYYTGAYPYERLAQAFINHNHGVRSNINLAAEVHKIENDKQAVIRILEEYITDEV